MKTMHRWTRACLCLVLSGCGLLASPSTGDVDLPTSVLGPYQQITSVQSPTGSRVLLSGSNGLLDEPNVTVRAGRRLVFASLTNGGSSTIGRSQERSPNSLAFEDMTSVFAPANAWEGARVGSPCVLVERDDALAMLYEAEGGIGLARSTDGGLTFTRTSTPILEPDATRGETVVHSPSVAKLADGGYLLAYESRGTLYGARARVLEGPWQRMEQPLLEPSRDTTTDAGLFESSTLGDPSLHVVQTAAGRSLYVLFYTARGSGAGTYVAGAASFDGVVFTRYGRPLVTDRMAELRMGSFEIATDRQMYLWLTAGSSSGRFVTVGVGPLLPRQLVGFAP